MGVSSTVWPGQVFPRQVRGACTPDIEDADGGGAAEGDVIADVGLEGEVGIETLGEVGGVLAAGSGDVVVPVFFFAGESEFPAEFVGGGFYEGAAEGFGGEELHDGFAEKGGHGGPLVGAEGARGPREDYRSKEGSCERGSTVI